MLNDSVYALSPMPLKMNIKLVMFDNNNYNCQNFLLLPTIVLLNSIA